MRGCVGGGRWAALGGREGLGALVGETERSAGVVRHWGSASVADQGRGEKGGRVIFFVFIRGGEEILMGAWLLG